MNDGGVGEGHGKRGGGVYENRGLNKLMGAVKEKKIFDKKRCRVIP